MYSILSFGNFKSSGMNAQPAFNTPTIEAIKSLLRGSIINMLLLGLTPFSINAFAIRFDFLLSSSYVSVSSVATSAISSGFSSTCASKRLCKNGFTTSSNSGNITLVASSMSSILNLSISLMKNCTNVYFIAFRNSLA